MAEAKTIKATVTIAKTRYHGSLYKKGDTVTGAVAEVLINAGKAKEVK